MPFAVILSEEISHRYDFALLCNARGYVDAVEVGTDQGSFAADFLAVWKGYWLLCLDPYEPYPELPYDRSLDMMVAVATLQPHRGRFRFVRHRSPDAIPFILTIIQPPGFVYLDGSHDEADVLADMKTWWEVLPETGLLAGHDYDNAHPGVVGAVHRFAEDRGLIVRLTHETTSPPSWYIYKTEPATLYVRLFRSADEANPHART